MPECVVNVDLDIRWEANAPDAALTAFDNGTTVLRLAAHPSDSTPCGLKTHPTCRVKSETPQWIPTLTPTPLLRDSGNTGLRDNPDTTTPSLRDSGDDDSSHRSSHGWASVDAEIDARAGVVRPATLREVLGSWL